MRREQLKKPEKKENKHFIELCDCKECGYNQACPEWEAYHKQEMSKKEVGNGKTT